MKEKIFKQNLNTIEKTLQKAKSKKVKVADASGSVVILLLK